MTKNNDMIDVVMKGKFIRILEQRKYIQNAKCMKCMAQSQISFDKHFA